MDCLEFRRMAGADPDCRDAAYLRHRMACRACAQYAIEMGRFDALIEAAMDLPVPEGLAARIKVDVSMRDGFRRRWLAAAASVLLMVGAAGGVWQVTRAEPLDKAVMDHIFHEPQLLVETERRVSEDLLMQVAEQGGAVLGPGMEGVAHARLCYFHGRLVTHLVIEGREGPVTVLLLPHEHVDRPMVVNESGFHGTILPVGSGSIAIVGNEDETLEPIRDQVASSLEWSI